MIPILAACFPCMRQSQGNDPMNIKTTITVQSTSSCCRGEIRKIHLSDSQVQEFKSILDEFLKKIDKVE
jgi:hypothetical protein